MSGDFDFGSEYMDYHSARSIEAANAPRSRSERRRAKKQRPAANQPKWVTSTIRALVILVGVWMALALLGRQLAWW